MHGIEAVRELIREEIPANIIQEIVALCINTKDQELFKLLNTHRIDVLRQLLFSTMNKDLFLQNLIELEKMQTVPNLIRLKNIDAYIPIAIERADPTSYRNFAASSLC